MQLTDVNGRLTRWAF